MIFEKCFVKFCFFAFLFFLGSNAVYEDSLTSRQKKLEEIRAYEGTYDPMTSRIEPSSKETYTITAERLNEIRQYLMYPYYDYDNDGHRGDLEMNINTHNTQVNKQLTFLLPFFGFGLNYTWVSINGYLGFSDAPFNWRTYPLFFPVAEWPDSPDPSFIGPFYSKCNIGQLRPGEDDENQKTPGVYWRLERDLPSRDDRLAVEIRERLKWDIREGIVGATIYNPKHAIIVTWKNVTFAGGSVNTDAKHVTNTFQLVVTTDEISTFAMFNYEYMTWTSHTEAGGSSDEGQGGVPAYVLDMPLSDLGDQAYKKTDIEAWIPVQKMFGEISSATSCLDYQSRRLNIRYRNEAGEIKLTHTLNGTACATPRVLITMIASNQTKDGDILVPEALQPYFNYKHIIRKEKRFLNLNHFNNRTFTGEILRPNEELEADSV